MIRLIQLLLFGHIHTWEETHKGKQTDNFTNGTYEEYQFYVLKCRTCGKVKRVNLK